MQSAQDDIDLTSMLAALRRSIWRILAATAILGIATYFVLGLVAPTFKSTAQVILEPSGRDLLRPQGESAPAAETKVDENEVASQVEVMRSRDLLVKVGASERLEQRTEFNGSAKGQGLVSRMLSMLSGAPAGLNPKERAIWTLEQNVKVTEVPKTRLINIDVTSKDAELAASIANAVAMAFLERNRSSQVKDASDTTTWIGSNIQDIKRQTEASESALERFRAESGLLSGQNNVTLNAQQLSELNTQLTQATAARTEAEARAQIVRDMIASDRVESATDIVKSPNMQQLYQQTLRIERDIGELSATLLPGHPRMRQLSAELDISKRRLSQEAKRVALGMEDDVKVASARETALRTSIARVTETQLKSSDAQAKLGSLEREAQSKRNTYDLLLQRLSEASNRRDRTAVSALASLNESAVPSRIPDSPKRLQLALLASAAALILGLFYVLSRELLRAAPRAGPDAPAPALAKLAEIASPKCSVPLPSASGHGPAMRRIPGGNALAKYVADIRSSGDNGRILITGESDTVDLLGCAADLAGRLASETNQVVLVDWTMAGDEDQFEAVDRSSLGLSDLVSGAASFEDVLRPGQSGPWHRISSGTGAKERKLHTHGSNVELVFAALDAIYPHVIVVAHRAGARDLLEALDGELALGVVCAARDRDPGAPIEEGFLGYDVPGMPLVWLEAHQQPGRAWFAKRTIGQTGAFPA